jgi:hypothetical protein
MPLPELRIDRILAAHAAGTALVHDAGLVPEPLDVTLAAERHRWWRVQDSLRSLAGLSA